MAKSKKRSRRGNRKKASQHSKAPDSPLPALPSFDALPTFNLATSSNSTSSARKRSIHDVASGDESSTGDSAKRHRSQSPSKAETSTGADDDGWQQIPIKNHKGRSSTYPELQLPSSRINGWVRISDLQSLLLHLLADTAAPQWLLLKNKSAIRHVVCLHVPGLSMDLFDGQAKLTTTDDSKPTTKPPSTLAEYFPVAINERTLPPPLEDLAGIFTHVLPVKAGGDSRKVFSPTNNMLNIPLPEDDSKAKPNPKKQSTPRLKITELLLTPEELIEDEYPLHSTQSTSQPQDLPADWLETDLSTAPPRIVESGSVLEGYTIYAIDCEMVTTASGSSLARISIVDWDNAVVLDELVKPDEPVLDYLTAFSGITADKLADVTTTRADIQKRLSTLLTANTILVGQSLNSDLHALHFSHPHIVDTSVIYDHPRGKPLKPGLRWLAQKHLNKQIQNGTAGHDSIEDARACLQLLKLKLERGKDFGTASANSEPLFVRLARVQPRPVTCGIVDTAANVEKRYATTAQYTHNAADDDGVVAGVLTAVNGDALAGIPPVGFTYARLPALADARGWSNAYGKFAAQMNTMHITATSPPIEIPERPPPPPPEELAKAVKETVGRIKAVYDGLPKCSVLMVYSGTGDPVEMGRLNALFSVHRREFKVKPWDKGTVQWTDREEEALKKEAREARKGIALLAVK
ncbi:hypothetical protein TWF696_001995 [Orbilia brochopaga]|uniref:Exonuclease domain-containing protein n=1 Tax=Orbilia brochopaga TaxID=3140254 RepID=A0AAV9U709_9PEZI